MAVGRARLQGRVDAGPFLLNGLHKSFQRALAAADVSGGCMKCDNARSTGSLVKRPSALWELGMRPSTARRRARGSPLSSTMT